MLDSKMLGYRIREYRNLSGLSQAELAKRIHVQPSTLCEYEAGRIIPSMKVFVNIVNGLHCTANDLLLDSIVGHRLNADMLSEERLKTVGDLIDTLDN